jgi:uncharacterized protein (TIGR01244 family)
MKLKLFAASFLVAFAGFSLLWFLNRPGPRPPRPQVVKVGSGVYVTSQLQLGQLRLLRRFGIQAIVDMRPDGEAADQPASSAIAAEAERSHLFFHYIPTPHGEIPDAVVDQLRDALDGAGLHTLLYCRTGRRAVRVYALVEASRAGGSPLEAILKMGQDAGFPIDDLRDSLAARIGRRDMAPPEEIAHE